MATVAISSAGPNLSDWLDPRFGRAAFFLIVDGETGEMVEAVENSNVLAAHGAGTGAAALMKEKRAAAVISGRFGPKAYEALQRLEIETYLAEEGTTAGDALAKFRAGELQKFGLKVY